MKCYHQEGRFIVPHGHLRHSIRMIDPSKVQSILIKDIAEGRITTESVASDEQGQSRYKRVIATDFEFVTKEKNFPYVKITPKFLEYLAVDSAASSFSFQKTMSPSNDDFYMMDGMIEIISNAVPKEWGSIEKIDGSYDKWKRDGERGYYIFTKSIKSTTITHVESNINQVKIVKKSDEEDANSVFSNLIKEEHYDENEVLIKTVFKEKNKLLKIPHLKEIRSTYRPQLITGGQVTRVNKGFIEIITLHDNTKIFKKVQPWDPKLEVLKDPFIPNQEATFGRELSREAYLSRMFRQLLGENRSPDAIYSFEQDAKGNWFQIVYLTLVKEIIITQANNITQTKMILDALGKKITVRPDVNGKFNIINDPSVTIKLEEKNKLYFQIGQILLLDLIAGNSDRIINMNISNILINETNDINTIDTTFSLFKAMLYFNHQYYFPPIDGTYAQEIHNFCNTYDISFKKVDDPGFFFDAIRDSFHTWIKDWKPESVISIVTTLIKYKYGMIAYFHYENINAKNEPTVISEAKFKKILVKISQGFMNAIKSIADKDLDTIIPQEDINEKTVIGKELKVLKEVLSIIKEEYKFLTEPLYTGIRTVNQTTQDKSILAYLNLNKEEHYEGGILKKIVFKEKNKTLQIPHQQEILNTKTIDSSIRIDQRNITILTLKDSFTQIIETEQLWSSDKTLLRQDIPSLEAVLRHDLSRESIALYTYHVILGPKRVPDSVFGLKLEHKKMYQVLYTTKLGGNVDVLPQSLSQYMLESPVLYVHYANDSPLEYLQLKIAQKNKRKKIFFELGQLLLLESIFGSKGNMTYFDPDHIFLNEDNQIIATDTTFSLLRTMRNLIDSKYNDTSMDDWIHNHKNAISFKSLNNLDHVLYKKLKNIIKQSLIEQKNTGIISFVSDVIKNQDGINSIFKNQGDAPYTQEEKNIIAQEIENINKDISQGFVDAISLISDHSPDEIILSQDNSSPMVSGQELFVLHRIIFLIQQEYKSFKKQQFTASSVTISQINNNENIGMYSDNVIKFKGNKKNGKPDGVWIIYNKKGKIILEIEYKEGEIEKYRIYHRNMIKQAVEIKIIHIEKLMKGILNNTIDAVEQVLNALEQQ